jgi:hypothetical protein
MTKDQETEFLAKLDEMVDGLQELVSEYEPKKETEKQIEQAIAKLNKAQGSL